MKKSGHRIILIFSPYLGGHHSLYIESLTRYWEEYHGGICKIVVSPGFIKLHKDITNYLGNSQSHIEFTAISKADDLYLKGDKHIILKAMREWQLLCDFASRYKATHCFVQFIDHLQFPLALKSRAKGVFHLSGIIFHPTLHYDNFPVREKSTIKSKINKIRKKQLLKLSLQNPSLKVLFSLDPYAVSEIRKMASHTKILHLPEAFLNTNNLSISRDSNLWGKFGVDPGRKVYLTFGALAPRKGVYQLLEAIKYLPEEIANQVCLLFVGQIAESENKELTSQIANTRSSSTVQIILYDEFIPDYEIGNIFMRSHTILAIYQREHVGSSGILVWAAATQKPVLATRYGMIGEYVREYKLGLTVEPTDPHDIAAKIKQSIMGNTEYYDISGMMSFSRQNNSKLFARTILNNLE